MLLTATTKRNGKSHEPGTTYPGVCSDGFSAHLDPVAAWNRQDSALLPLATVGVSGRVMLAAGPYYGYDTLSSYQRVISIEVNGLCHACYLAEESAYYLATHLELIAEPSEFGDALRARPTCGNHHLPTVELGQASRELADLGVELVVRDSSRSVEAFALHKEQKRTRQERVARRQRSLRQYQFEDLAVAMRRYLASHKSVQ